MEGDEETHQDEIQVHQPLFEMCILEWNSMGNMENSVWNKSRLSDLISKDLDLGSRKKCYFKHSGNMSEEENKRVMDILWD